MTVKANGIVIKFEDTARGAPPDSELWSRPVVMLIMGLGMQLVAWPSEIIEVLEEEGYRVIRFDNRDVGLSQHMEHLGTPNLVWAGIKSRMGIPPNPPYSLRDMADDAIGVLDALKIKKAHIIGVSMGGMIAQRVAIAAPKRVLSLTSIMSSSGAKGLPAPRRAVMGMLLKRPPRNNPQAYIDHMMHIVKVIGSPAYPTPEADLRKMLTTSIERKLNPIGTLRQLVAVLADVTRSAQLSRIQCPTLVLHGKADLLVPYSHGEDTARRIPGARLIGYEGMGHDLPALMVNKMLREIVPHLKASDVPVEPVAPAPAMPPASPAVSA